jgi:hypothetical protein
MHVVTTIQNLTATSFLGKVGDTLRKFEIPDATKGNNPLTPFQDGSEVRAHVQESLTGILFITSIESTDPDFRRKNRPPNGAEPIQPRKTLRESMAVGEKR